MAPVWFITAASSGFGREMVLSALKLGHTVIATARNPSRIDDLKAAGAHTMAFDVKSPLADLQATAKDVFAKFGRVDYLINAAGYILEGSVEECTPEEFYDMFHTNVFGITSTLKAFLPHMRAQELGENGTRGTVVGIGSLGSWMGGASFSGYAMTKCSVSLLMESLVPELQPFQIRSTVIEPGYFRTNFLEAMVPSKERIPAYSDPDTPTGKTRNVLPQVNGNQPGDVVKGARISVEVLTGTGVGKGKELPLRIVLGSDCEKVIRDKCESTLKLLDEWEDVIRSSDYAE